MPFKLNYKIIASNGEKTSKNNNAFGKLENMINVYLNGGLETSCGNFSVFCIMS